MLCANAGDVDSESARAEGPEALEVRRRAEPGPEQQQQQQQQQQDTDVSTSSTATTATAAAGAATAAAPGAAAAPATPASAAAGRKGRGLRAGSPRLVQEGVCRLTWAGTGRHVLPSVSMCIAYVCACTCASPCAHMFREY